MNDTDLAYAHYLLTFPTLASLGTGTPPVTWFAEYNRVAASGLSATLITGNSADGSSATAIRNFDQKVLLSALHEIRAKHDSAYQGSLVGDRPLNPSGKRMGSIVRFYC